jgi:hypothetical protein
MNIPTPKNKNYCATVVALQDIYSLEGMDNARGARVFGNQVIVSKSSQIGDIGLFFPVETALDEEFLIQNGLLREKYGKDDQPPQKGFFDPSGRVKAIKMRGHKSEGFWCPISFLGYLGDYNIPVLTDLDEIDDHIICRKYVAKRNPTSLRQHQPRAARAEDRILEGQFRFHYDTANLRRNAHVLTPNKEVIITEKLHGTSICFGKLLTERPLKWTERLAKRLGIKVDDKTYELVWSSRRVIKGVGEPMGNKQHFYKTDLWGEVAREEGPKIPDSYTIYGEIVGYTPDGAEIQKCYTYGCLPGKHKLFVYRVTSTGLDGSVIELTWGQMTEFCERHGLETVPFRSKGRVSRITGLESATGDQYVEALEHMFVGGDCRYNPGIPAEGVVVRIDHLHTSEAYKIKNFDFLLLESKQADKGVVDIESEESVDAGSGEVL